MAVGSMVSCKTEPSQEAAFLQSGATAGGEYMRQVKGLRGGREEERKGGCACLSGAGGGGGGGCAAHYPACSWEGRAVRT